jgi:division protein CdvB (Snf7/Vps24/ESCRT-III family)
MAAVNQSLDPLALQHVMNNFSREMEKVSIAEESWDDVVDMFDGDGVGEEADEVVDRVLDELGLEVGRKFDNLSCPSSAVNEAVYDEVVQSISAHILTVSL